MRGREKGGRGPADGVRVVQGGKRGPEQGSTARPTRPPRQASWRCRARSPPWATDRRASRGWPRRAVLPDGARPRHAGGRRTRQSWAHPHAEPSATGLGVTWAARLPNIYPAAHGGCPLLTLTPAIATEGIAS